MPDDTKDETLTTETAPVVSGAPRVMSTFKAPAHRFALGEELGRGGMGQVIAARDVSLKRGVAIKKVLSTRDVDLERFDREVRITAELEHPSIVPIHDVGTDDDGRPFYVMRQIRGEPLSTRIAALPTLRARLALLPNLLAVTDAAAFAHARRILHRDIKPANILLGAFGETLLIDWGLARRLDELEPRIPEAADSLPGGTLTVAGYVYGTPGYMAPEQARGELVDARADVFALGATLFHVLAGRGPYDRMSAGERMQAAIEEVPPPFELLPEDAPGELRAIAIKAMAVDPAHRYPDAGAMAADLRAFLEGQLVGAHSYTTSERFLRFVRRNRVAVLATTLAIIVGGVALVRVVLERNERMIATERADFADTATRNREERILVEQASLFADFEPARAIAKLRHLPEDSSYLPRARDIAAKAAARGIPRGDRVHGAMVTGLAFSPDGQRLASSDVAGRVVVRLLATPQVTLNLDIGEHAARVLWLDSTRLVVQTHAHVALIDIAGKRVEALLDDPRHDGLVVAVGPDHLRYVAATADELVEYTISTGARRVVAHDVTVMYAQGDRTLISGSSGVRWLVGDREVPLTSRRVSDESNLTISADGRAVAIAGDDEVVEVDETGRELRRWPVRFASRPFYAVERYLYAQTSLNTLVRLGKDATQIMLPTGGMARAVRTDRGLAIALESGRVLLADNLGLRNLAFGFEQTVRVAGSPVSSMLAMGSLTGEVRWWDLEIVAPVARDVGSAQICEVTETKTYLRTDDRLVEVERATGKQRVVSEDLAWPVAECGTMLANGVLAVATPFSTGTIDLHTGVFRKLTRGPIVADVGRQTIVLASGDKLIEFPEGRGEGQVVWTAPTTIVRLDIAGRWMLARLADDTLVRRDLRTGETVPVTRVPGVSLPFDNGAVLYTTNRWLWQWSETDIPVLRELASPIAELGGSGTSQLLRLKDGTVWLSDSTDLRLITHVGRLLASSEHQAVFVIDEGVVLLSLHTGERINYTVPARTDSLRQSWDKRRLSMIVARRYLITFVDEVPSNPAAFQAWLKTATNAQVDKHTDVLTWKLATASPETPRAP